MDDETLADMHMLKRIVALLLSLSDLAERATNHYLPLCALIVWVLRPAEAAASAYADLPPDAMATPFVRSGSARVDAMRLARRFRVLADEVLREVELEVHFAHWQAHANRDVAAGEISFMSLLQQGLISIQTRVAAGLRQLLRCDCGLAFWQLALPDTS